MKLRRGLYLVIKNHQAVYKNPIRLTKGDRLDLSGRRDNWDGHTWLWAKAEDGREGWIPDDLPVIENGMARAAYNYSAFELDVDKGEYVTILGKSHGWAWCAKGNRTKGWVPKKVLTRIH